MTSNLTNVSAKQKFAEIKLDECVCKTLNIILSCISTILTKAMSSILVFLI